jgi:PAS domain S-box-containing protein
MQLLTPTRTTRDPQPSGEGMADNGAVQDELTLRQMVDGISALVAVLTPDGAVEFVNRQVLDYFGRTTEELKKWGSTDAVHPDDLPRVIAAWSASVASGQPYDVEIRQRRADGVYRWFHVQGLPVADAAGCILRWCVLQTDIDERKRGETALTTAFEEIAKSEAELRTIIDAIPQLIIAIGPDGHFQSANQAFLDYTGLTKDEVRTHSFGDVFHPGDSERLHDQRSLAISRKLPFEYERRVRRRDGQYRWLLVQYNPLLDERAEVIRWYATGTDIDDRKRAEDVLRSNEQSLRLIVDSIPGFVSTVNAAGEIEIVNRPILEYFGKTIEEFRNWATSDALHPEDLPRMIEAWRLAIETGQPLDDEHRSRRADGVYRWFHIRSRPQRDAEGRIVRWYNLVTDIHERKRAEEAQRQTEHHLRLLVETIPALVSRTTAEGALDYVNQRIVDYFGQGLGELGIHVVHPDDRSIFLRNWRHALKAGNPFEDTCRMRRADGEYRWFYQRTEPLLDQDGRVVCWYSVSFDIEDSRQMEEILRSTRRKLSAAMQIATVAELSASIAHEINQPLASVVTNAHAAQTWLSHDPPNVERLQAILERIIRDGHSAAEVVRRIRALFKEAAPVKALLDMNQLVAEVLRVLSDELSDHTITVETELEADLPMVAADHVQIQQTLINLVHNGTEAMAGLTDRPKLLVLGSRRQGDDLLIQVRDCGVGIKDPTLVFEPFFTTKESGMGMGLSISRSIIEAHGGRIWVTANEDAGTTFSFTLPLASERSA